ncbi:MAG: 4Fe-4S dicluster domain-containing protein, partial [Candidatus Syntropharchaeia archaeon]
MSMYLKIIREYCKGCNLCVEVCPKNVFSPGKTISERGYIVPLAEDQKNCTDFKRIRAGKHPVCGLCILSCPDQAIEPLYEW